MSVNYLLKDKYAPQSDIKCNSVNVNRLSVERFSGTNLDDSGPIVLQQDASGLGLYEGIWTQAGAIGTDNNITLSITLPAGWDAEGQRPMITYVSSNPQELCSLNQITGDQLDFSIWNVSPSVVAVNVTRTIRILLV
jgi:hypothetical protein